RGCGLAHARQLYKQLEVLTHLQSLDSLCAPQVLFGQSIRASLCQGLDLKLVDLVGVFEPDTLGSQVVDVLQFLGAPLAPATTRLPPCQTGPAALAYDGLWRWIDLQKSQRGGLRQALNQWMQLRKREVNGGSQLVAQLTAAFLEGHVPPHQAVGGRE